MASIGLSFSILHC